MFSIVTILVSSLILSSVPASLAAPVGTRDVHVRNMRAELASVPRDLPAPRDDIPSVDVRSHPPALQPVHVDAPVKVVRSEVTEPVAPQRQHARDLLRSRRRRDATPSKEIKGEDIHDAGHIGTPPAKEKRETVTEPERSVTEPASKPETPMKRAESDVKRDIAPSAATEKRHDDPHPVVNSAEPAASKHASLPERNGPIRVIAAFRQELGFSDF